MTMNEFITKENSTFPQFVEAPIYSSDEEKQMTSAIVRINNNRPGVIKYLCNEVNARFIASFSSLLEKQPVTQSNNTHLYNLILDVSKKLGVRMPKVYTYNDQDVQLINEKTNGEITIYSNNAFTMGTREMLYVFVSDEIIDCNDLSDIEIKALIGHEMGHALSNHLVYTEVFLSNNIQTARYLSKEELYQFKRYYKNDYFSRCNEITADRAGLIACRSEEGMISMLNKIHGESGWGYKHSKASHPNGYVRTEAVRLFAKSRLYAEAVGLIDGTNPSITDGMIGNEDLSDTVSRLLK